MKVLITGGAGYVGTELVRKLAEMAEVSLIKVYDNLSRDNYSFFLGSKMPGYQKLKFINGEILDTRNLRKAMEGVDVVYHLAAKVTTPFANVDAHYYEQTNHWGTAEVVYAAETCGIKRLVYTSSIGIYGSSSKEMSESTEPNPKTFYAISKYRGEEHVSRLMDKYKTYIVRCGNVFGYSPAMRFDAVVNRFVFEGNFNGRISIHGDGKQNRSFIHIDKLTTALARLSVSELDSGVYNLVEHNLSILDIVENLRQLIPHLEFIFVNQHLRLRKIAIKPNIEMNQLAGITNGSNTFYNELRDFIDKLSF